MRRFVISYDVPDLLDVSVPNSDPKRMWKKGPYPHKKLRAKRST